MLCPYSIQLGVLGYIIWRSVELELMSNNTLELVAIISTIIAADAYIESRTSRNMLFHTFRFDTIYALFLPIMLSLLYTKESLIPNIVLCLNACQLTAGRWPVLLIQSLLLYRYVPRSDLSQCFLSLIANSLFNSFLHQIGELKSLDNIDCSIFSTLLTNIIVLINSNTIHFKIVRGTLLAFGSSLIINVFLGTFLAVNSKLRSAILLISLVTTFPYGIQNLVDVSFEGSNNPILWLLDIVKYSRVRHYILIVWLFSVGILVPNVISYKSKFSLNTSRKIWHFLILLLILYPFYLDPYFVKIALAGVIVLFLVVEYIRFLQLEPFGTALDQTLRSFADFRDDRGPIIISYIYLIIGISFPLLVADSPVGLISLGLGDSMASIIGKKFGKHRWPNTSKTLEGSLAFFSSTFAVTVIAKEFLGFFQYTSIYELTMLCIASGILEGNSHLNDNILIPALMLIIEGQFKCNKN